MKLYVIKTNTGLKPCYSSDYDSYVKIPLGEEFEIEFKQKRNIKFHRKFFGLIKMIFENQEQYNNIEHLRRDLIIESGNYDLRHDLNGIEVREAKSISFAKMSQNEFDKLYSDVIDVIIKYFHFDKEEILLNVEQYF